MSPVCGMNIKAQALIAKVLSSCALHCPSVPCTGTKIGLQILLLHVNQTNANHLAAQAPFLWLTSVMCLHLARA